jgi:hypothetical protein
MNEAERCWLQSVAEAERGVPVVAGSSAEPTERAEPAGDQPRMSYPLWFAVFLTFGLLLLPLEALGKAALPAEWADRAETHVVTHLVAVLAASLAWAAIAPALLRRPPAPPSAPKAGAPGG